MSNFFVEQEGGHFGNGGLVNPKTGEKFQSRKEVRKVLLSDGGVFESPFGGRWKMGKTPIEELPSAPKEEDFEDAALYMLTAKAPRLNDFGRKLRGAGARCVVSTCSWTDKPYFSTPQTKEKQVCEMELVFWEKSGLGSEPLFSEPYFATKLSEAKKMAEARLITILQAALRKLPRFSSVKEKTAGQRLSDCEYETRHALEKGAVTQDRLQQFAESTGAALDFDFRKLGQVWVCKCVFESIIHKVAGEGEGPKKKTAQLNARIAVSQKLAGIEGSESKVWKRIEDLDRGLAVQNLPGEIKVGSKRAREASGAEGMEAAGKEAGSEKQK